MSGRKALAALGAAARQDLAATSGQHAGTEAMAALTNEPARLICALHDTFSEIRQSQHVAASDA